MVFVVEAAGSRLSSRLEGGAPGFGAPASCRLDERLPAARTVESEPRSRPSADRGERLFRVSHRRRSRPPDVTLAVVCWGRRLEPACPTSWKPAPRGSE